MNRIPEGLPKVWQICSHCRGNGQSSAYLGAFTQEDREQDPDFFEAYMEGEYDRPCDVCGGTGKVQEVDVDNLDEVQRLAYDEFLDDCQEVAAERRMRALEDGDFESFYGGYWS